MQQEHKAFLSVIANDVSLIAEELTQFSDQVKMRLISQEINTISTVPQKLLKYFNGTDILTSFTLPLAGGFSVNLVFDLSVLEFSAPAAGSSL